MALYKTILTGLVAVMLVLFVLVGAPTSRANVAEPAPSGGDSYVWNLAEDFQVWPNQANPNPDSYGNAGIWSFMRTTDAHDPSTYALVTQFYPDLGEHPGQQGWAGPEPHDQDPHVGLPQFQMNTTGMPIVLDPGSIEPPGIVRVHPDSSQPAIVGWHSLFTGAIAIAGGVTDLNSTCGDGIQWFIDKNSMTVASGSYPEGGAQLFKDGTNGNQLGNIPVNQGDVIYFLVAPGGNYYCDATQLDVTITMVSIAKPAAPGLVGPANGASVPKKRVTLDWADVPFATHYKVLVKDEANTTVAALTIFEASVVNVGLPPNHTFSWHVKACNSGGCSGKSDVWHFNN